MSWESVTLTGWRESGKWMEGEWLLSVEGRVRLTVGVAKERVPWGENAK